MSEKRNGTRRAGRIVAIVLTILIIVLVAAWLVYKNSPEVRDWAADAGLVGTTNLAGTAWSWQRSEFSNGSRIEGPGGEAFVLSFEENGHFTSTTDCNSLFGTFSAVGGWLSLGPIASTKMWCGPDSLELEYSRQLDRAASFSVVVNELRIELADDSGQMIFLKR